MLSFIFTARYPSAIKKLVLIGSVAFEEKYAVDIMKTRLGRLNDEERSEVLYLMETLSDPSVKNKNTLMARLGELISKADSYDTLSHDSEILLFQYDSTGVYGNKLVS